MNTCPRCGRFMSNRLSCGRNQPVKLLWYCPVCGLVAVQDRSGYKEMDIVDKYGLMGYQNRKVM